jgi:outer membrane protein OmpA-like peptidoglycan-associated protein
MTAQLLGKPFRIAAVLIAATGFAAGIGAFIVTAAADPPTSLAERLKAVQSGEADEGPKKGPPLVPFKPVDATTSTMVIPLAKGLFVVAARSTPTGDYEWYDSVEDVSASTVKIQATFSDTKPHAGAAAGDNAAPNTTDSSTKGTRCQFIVDVSDFAKAHSMRTWACKDKVEHYPGITTLSVSTEVLKALRDGKSAEVHLPALPNEETGEAIQNILRLTSGQALKKPSVSDYAGLPSWSCTLNRLGTTDVAVPVLVNDQPVRLPALRAGLTCLVEDQKAQYAEDLYFLDQPSNAVLLVEDNLQVSLRTTQVIKISFPPEALKDAPPKTQAASDDSRMERALADKRAVQVYGIYFDFNSADIRPESDPVLRKIADIMQQNPDWKLSVSGHTDNVGGAQFNLALSQRRAAAVKDALVTRFKIAPGRLQTSGYGASSPLDTNETLEGRARNRRVELRRL